MNGAAYWAKRILKDEARAQAMANKTSRMIQREYKRSMKRALTQVEGLYAAVSEEKPVTRTQLWNYAKWRSLDGELNAFAAGSAKEAERLRETLDRVFRDVIGAEVSQFGQKQFRMTADPSGVINSTWSGKSFSERIWTNRTALAHRIREEVTQAVLDGKSVGRVAKDLESAFSVSYRQAERLARTETSYVFNRASLKRYEALGIKKVRWITGPNDGRECPICSERSDQVYPVDSAPMMPAHPNCRCAWGAVVTFEGEILTDKEGHDILKLDDAPINAVGAASSRNPNVINPETGLPLNYVTGRRPEYPPDHNMAGLGCKTGREIDDIDRLVDTYHANAEGWHKEKARYWVFDANMEERQVELHWYQHKDIVGKVEPKIKLGPHDEVYTDEW